MRKPIIALAAAVALTPIPAANATTYIVNETVAGGSLTGTITTDDTLGILSAANITGYALNIANGGMSGTIDPFTTFAFVDGNALTATGTGLFFDFGGTSSDVFAFFGTPGPLGVCFQVSDFCFTGSSVISLQFGDGTQITGPRTGNYQFASAVAGAIPEPAIWAMMIAGFGVIGFGLRRRQSRKVTVHFA